MTAKDMPLPEPAIETNDPVNGPAGFYTTSQVLSHREEYAAARCAELEAVLRELVTEHFYEADNGLVWGYTEDTSLEDIGAKELADRIRAAIASRTEVKP